MDSYIEIYGTTDLATRLSMMAEDAQMFLNGDAPKEHQAKFDAMALEPIDPEVMAHDGYSMVRARSIDFEFAVS